MKILLEAFIDNNFGDNLFVYMLTKRYPQHTFFMLEKAGYEESYEVLTKQFEKVIVIKEQVQDDFINSMDGMLVVGGDMFGNGGDYTQLIRQVHFMKKRGGFVGFLGISLFKEYSRKTWFDLMVLFSYADFIVVRESSTYYQLKKMIPWLKITCSADMAFSLNKMLIKQEEVQAGLLGISVRKKSHENAEIYYPGYCYNIAETVIAYLNEKESNHVVFLAFSSGRYNDTKVAEDIVELLPLNYKNRVQIHSFDGNVVEYMKKIEKCEKLLCTRFHALVFALLFDKMFLPIIYEEKMERLLNEIGYEGKRLYYDKGWQAGDVIKNMISKGYDLDKYEKYMKKATLFFQDPDRMGTKGNIKIFHRIRNSSLYLAYYLKQKLS